MALQLRRPILVGGLGLTASLWLLEALHPSATHLGGTVIWGAIALGSGFWWLRQRQQSLDLTHSPALPVNRTAVEKEIATVERLLNQLATETPSADSSTDACFVNLRQRLTEITLDLDRQQARLSIMGGKAVGKTSLTQRLASHWAPPAAADLLAPPHAAGVGSTLALEALPTADVSTADLVLFVTTGDLTDSEFQAIDQLLKRQQRVLLVFNKQDQYLPAERSLVLQHLRDRLREQLPSENVVAIATQPSPVKVRQHQLDGSVQERLEQLTPDILPLTERLGQILTQEGPQLILATGLRQILTLKTDILTHLNQRRRDRALPLIEQSQWIAAATAFANPVPSLDLLATAAINTQLVMDLGAIYQHTFSLHQAKTTAVTLAELMVKLGLVELSSQAIAPLLKSNALTYVAGGLLQGVSAAYLTRVAGLSLIDYFQEQSQQTSLTPDSPFQFDRLTQKLKAIFQDNQRPAFLQTLVKQGIARLVPEASASA